MLRAHDKSCLLSLVVMIPRLGVASSTIHRGGPRFKSESGPQMILIFCSSALIPCQRSHTVRTRTSAESVSVRDPLREAVALRGGKFDRNLVNFVNQSRCFLVLRLHRYTGDDHWSVLSYTQGAGEVDGEHRCTILEFDSLYPSSQSSSGRLVARCTELTASR